MRLRYTLWLIQAKRVAIGLLLILCIPHIHCLIYSQAQLNIWWVCWQVSDSMTTRILSAVIEFTVGYVVIIVVFVLNLILSFHIYRNQIPSAPSSQCNLTAYKRQTHNRRLTRTLLVVAVVFLVCETPRMLTSLLLKLIEKTPIRRIILNAAFALSGVNHAANFFIYIVLSPRFRQLLVERLRPATDFVVRCFEPYLCRNNGLCRRCVGRGGLESGDVTVQFSLQVFDGPTAYPDL